MSEKEEVHDLSGEFVLELTNAQPRLYGFLLKRLVQREQAIEVLQNVNLTICSKSKEYQPNTDFMAWAFKIAHFQLMAFRKTHARDKLVFAPSLSSLIEDTDSSFAESQTQAERRSALKSCLSILSIEQQGLLAKRYTESVSVQAIAAELDKTPNAVSLLLHRIRLQLLNCINQKLLGELE